jgi:hypothetical protein
MAANGFSVGGLHGWYGVMLGLLGSALFMISGRQDVGPGVGMTSSAFWFLLALALTAGVTWLAFGARMWGEALTGVAFLCLEVWLIHRWWWRQLKQHQ